MPPPPPPPPHGVNIDRCIVQDPLWALLEKFAYYHDCEVSEVDPSKASKAEESILRLTLLHHILDDLQYQIFFIAIFVYINIDKQLICFRLVEQVTEEYLC